jgi:hypothetical protein
MNDNSSRFGKFTMIKISNGKVVGAGMENYLLEKARLVRGNGVRARSARISIISHFHLSITSFESQEYHPLRLTHTVSLENHQYSNAHSNINDETGGSR